MTDERCGCGFKDECYFHCNHELEACPGEAYKGSDLVAPTPLADTELDKSAQPTQSDNTDLDMLNAINAGKRLWVCHPDDDASHIVIYNGDGCPEHVIAGGSTLPTHTIKHLITQARIDMADDILRKVKLEYAAGGRYPGHIILPWEEIVRPYLQAELKAKT